MIGHRSSFATIAGTDTGNLTVRVPMRLGRTGGRKVMIAANGEVTPARPPLADQAANSPLARALAQAFRWHTKLESGACSTVAEIARDEGVNDSYVSRVIRLTLLSPDIVEAIVDGRQPDHLKLADLLKPLPDRWDQQRAIAGVNERDAS